MKKIFKFIIANQFFRGSFVMLVGINFYNFSQFVYHFLAGRFLGRAFYGDLASIISIMGIIGIVQQTLGLTMVKFIASEKQDKVGNFIKWVYYWTWWAAAAIAVVVLILSQQLIQFLNLSESLSIYLLPPLLLFYIMANTSRSILQGLLKFDKYILSLLAEAVVKIILTVMFIFLGYAILGVIGALLVGTALSFLITRISLANYLSGPKEEKPKVKTLFSYSSAVFIQGLALTSMYTSDLFLVKHFFSPDQAGLYASLAILGRIVFFSTTPIIHVMFPTIAKRHSVGEKYSRVFYLSLLLIIGVGILITGFYYLFPNWAILILFGKGYLEGSHILWWFALFMCLVSLAMLLTQFFLSIGRTKIVFAFVLAALLQIILISLIHRDLLTVVQISILSAALLNLALFVYFIILTVYRNR